MLRGITVAHEDGDYRVGDYEIWVNPALVAAIRPASGTATCWVQIATNPTRELKARGSARDVALSLNGHFDD